MNKEKMLEVLKSKREDVEDYKSWTENEKLAYQGGILFITDLVEQLEIPEIASVPEYIVNWVQYCQNTNISLYGALDIDVIKSHMASKEAAQSVITYLSRGENQDDFARAWLGLYELAANDEIKILKMGMMYFMGGKEDEEGNSVITVTSNKADAYPFTVLSQAEAMARETGGEVETYEG